MSGSSSTVQCNLSLSSPGLVVRHPQMALLGWMVFLTLPEQIWVAARRLKSFVAHEAELGLGGMGEGEKKNPGFAPWSLLA